MAQCHRIHGVLLCCIQFWKSALDCTSVGTDSNTYDLLTDRDVSSFGSLQALPSWLSQFGDLQPDGSYKLGTQRQSIMNSVVWPGKLTGTLIFDPVLERLGYKRTAFLVACIQTVALIST